tara:strand:+ start:142 stop:315 length:174 start_codon:yes stop_codon:yes gene_type:complete
MFDRCSLNKNNACPFCTKEKLFSYCGIATNVNKIQLMKKCPYQKRKRKTTLTNWKII